MKLLTVNVSSTLLTSARRRSSSIKGSFATPCHEKRFPFMSIAKSARGKRYSRFRVQICNMNFKNWNNNKPIVCQQLDARISRHGKPHTAANLQLSSKCIRIFSYFTNTK
jgi:hypothetical protein